MKSDDLISLINHFDFNTFSELKNALETEGFTIQDKTEEGDSILHVLCRSSLSKNREAFNDLFLQCLQKGADINAVNDQGLSAVHELINLNLESQLLVLVLNQIELNLEQVHPQTKKSLLELIALSNVSDNMKKEQIEVLLKQPQFNPNQDSILQIIAINFTYERDQTYLINCLFNHPHFNPNKEGLLDNISRFYTETYTKKELINKVWNHPEFNPNKEHVVDIVMKLDLDEYDKVKLIELLIKHQKFNPNKGNIIDAILQQSLGDRNKSKLIDLIMKHADYILDQENYIVQVSRSSMWGQAKVKLIESLLEHQQFNLNKENLRDTMMQLSLASSDKLKMINALINHPKFNPNEDNIFDMVMNLSIYDNDKYMLIEEIINHPEFNYNKENTIDEIMTLSLDDSYKVKLIKLITTHTKFVFNQEVLIDKFMASSMGIDSKNSLIKMLFSHKDFNPNKENIVDTVMELPFIVYDKKKLILLLINHAEFNVNQEKIIDSILKLPLEEHDKYNMIWSIINNQKFIFNQEALLEKITKISTKVDDRLIKNIFSHKQFNPNQGNIIDVVMKLPVNNYDKMELISSVINHPDFNVNQDNIIIIISQLTLEEYNKFKLFDSLFDNPKFTFHQEALLEKIKNVTMDGNEKLIKKIFSHNRFNPNQENTIDMVMKLPFGDHNKIDLIKSIINHPDFNVSQENVVGMISGLPLSDTMKAYLVECLINNPKFNPQVSNNSQNKYSLLDTITSSGMSDYLKRLSIISFFKHVDELGNEVEINELFVYFFKNSGVKSTYFTEIFKEILTTIKYNNFDRIISLINDNVPDDQLKITAINEVRVKQYYCNFLVDNFDSDYIDSELDLLQKVNGSFVEDTILFGHLFSLSGKTPSSTGLVTLEGSSFIKTGFFMSHLLTAYLKHCEETGKFADSLEMIKRIRNTFLKGWRIVSHPVSSFENAILDAVNKEGAEILTGWPGHGVSLFIIGDQLFRNNGGGCSAGATVERYTITKPETIDVKLISTLIKNSRIESNKSFIQKDLHEILGLKLQHLTKGKFQTVGNCTFESLRISLLSKYDFFLEKKVAEEITQDTLQFMEYYYLQEYCERYKDDPFLTQVLMRLIRERLVPEGRLDLAQTLIRNFFTRDSDKFIAQCDLQLLKHFSNGKRYPGEVDRFLTELQRLSLPAPLNSRLALLTTFLSNAPIQDSLWEKIKQLDASERVFQGYDLLQLAVSNDNIPVAKKLIELFPESVTSGNWDGKSAINYAKSSEMAELLIANGAVITSNVGPSVLDSAVINNLPDVVRTLAQHGASLSDHTIVYVSNRPDMLEILMHHYPANQLLSQQGHDYSTLVHDVAKYGSEGDLKKLIHVGANPNSPDVNGITPLTQALRSGNKKKAKYLMHNPLAFFKPTYRGDDFDEVLKQGAYSPTTNGKLRDMYENKNRFKANYSQDEARIKEQGIVREKVDELIVALRLDDEETIYSCLLNNPELSITAISDLYCTSLLHDAILSLAYKEGKEYKARLKLIKNLLEVPGLQINAKNNADESLLMMATSIGNLDVLRLLLANPLLDVNQADNTGTTPLHDAASRGFVDVVSCLLADPRTDILLQDQHHQTAEEIATNEIKACIQQHSSGIVGTLPRF